jgi:serine/threonine-protein kinase
VRGSANLDTFFEMEPYPGAQLGAYSVERKVGEGSFGAVWCGVHLDTGERVALKVLLPAAAANPEQVSRFRREAKLLALVRSPHVARMVDVLVDGTFGVVLVMEFIDGELLSDLLGAATLAVDETLDIGAQVLDGVCDLHAAGIVHRDLKPNNIMLCTKGDGSRRAVVFDLGLSRLVRAAAGLEDSTRSLTGSHVALGTLECMAPEQVLNARDVTARSDIYSLGCVLYRAMAGYYPFASEDERDVARCKLTLETPEIAVAPGDPVAEGLRVVIAKATRRRPAQRYETAQQMRDDLRALQATARARAAATSAAARSATEDQADQPRQTQPPGLGALGQGQRPARGEMVTAFVVGIAVFCGLVGAALVWRALHP